MGNYGGLMTLGGILSEQKYMYLYRFSSRKCHSFHNLSKINKGQLVDSVYSCLLLLLVY